MFRTGTDEVEEASTAIELGEEKSGVGLRVRGFDPLKARSYGAAIAATFAQYPASIAAHPHSSLRCTVRGSPEGMRLVFKSKLRRG